MKFIRGSYSTKAFTGKRGIVGRHDIINRLAHVLTRNKQK